MIKKIAKILSVLTVLAFASCGSESSGGGGDSGSLNSVSINSSASSTECNGSVSLTAVPSVSGSPSVTYAWEITSGSKYAELSAATGKTVSLTGKNTTSSNQDVSVTVTAKSGSVTKTSTSSITFRAQTEAASLDSVTISGTTEIEATAEGTLTATPHYTGSLDTSSISYTWTITSGSTYASIAGTGAPATITGKNTDSSAHEVTVKVSAVYGTTTKEETCTVSVAAVGTHIENALTALTLDASTSTVAPDGTVVLTPTATYTGSLNESDFTVSDWALSSYEYADLKVPGTLEARPRSALVFTGDNKSILQAANTTTSSKTVTASVKVSYGGVEKPATCNVTIQPAKVTSVAVSGTTSLDACDGTTTLTADVSKNGNPATVTYSWAITDGSDYAEINGSASSSSVTIKGTNTTSSAHTVTVKVIVSDGTNSVSKTVQVSVPKDPNNTSKPALYPAKGETAAYADTQLILTFTSTPTLVSGKSVKIYTSSGTLVDTINILPTSDDTQSTQSGYSINTGNQQLVRVSGNSVYIQPHYNGSSSATKLSYGTGYYVEIDKSAITTSGTLVGGTAWNGFSGSSGWTFTTKSSPSISTSSAITVSNDTSSTDADFFSVYGALCAVGKKSSGTYEIDVAATEDPYYELISVQSSGANVVIKGQGSETYGSDVVIEYVNNVYMNNSTHTRAVFYYKGSGDLTLENITIKNLTERNVSYTADGLHAASEYQAEALTFYTSGNLAAYNCSFVSKQDTILLNSGRAWFYKSHIEGDVDFIWGSATAALFEECEIESILTEKSAYLTETRVGTVGASTVGKGYVFLNSTIKGNGGSNATYLSRLASSNAKSSPSKTTYDQVAFINSTFDSSAKVDASLWVATDAKYPRFIEKDSDGNVNVGWKTYGNTGITPVTTEYAGEITDALYAVEYNGRYAILNRLYNVDYEAYQTNSSVWSLTSLESEFSASADASKNNAFTEPDTSTSTTIKWDFTTIASGTTYEGKTGTFAATAGTGTLYVDATSGKIATRGTDAQFNSGTIAYIPASAGDTVSVTLYNGNYTLGTTTATSATTEITVAAGDLTTYNGVSCVALTATGSEYLYLISVVPGNGGSSSGQEKEVTVTYFPSSASSFSAAGTSTDTGIVTAANAAASTETGGTLTTAFGTVNSVPGHYYSTGSVTGNSGDTILTLTLSLTAVEDFTIKSVTGSLNESATGNISRTLTVGSNAALSLGSGKEITLNETGINYAVSAGSTVNLVFTTSSTAAYSGKTFKQLFKDIVITVSTTAEGSGGSGGSSGGTSSSEYIIADGGTITDSDTSGATGTLAISSGDVPTGYAGVGYASAYGSLSWITQTVSTRSALVSAANHSSGNYLIIVDGMIDMTDGMLPSKSGESTTALDSFVNTKSSGAYSTYEAWVAAYAKACSLTSDDETENTTEGSGNTTLYSKLWALSNAYKSQIQLNIKSNTIIVGKDASSGIKGGTLSMSGVSNVQLRNLIIQDAYDPFPHHENGDGYNAQWDGIVIQGDCSYIWIDHCTIQDTMTVSHVKTGGTTTEKWQTYDGLLDIKGNGQNITVSYCKFKNHDKTSLIGNTDSTETYTNSSGTKVTVTSGYRKITYHHNYFYNCGQRLPMVRYTTMHLYNNLYKSSSPDYTQQYAVGVRTGSIIYSENNYFDTGILYAFSGDTSSSKVGTFYSSEDKADSTVTLYNSSKGISAPNGSSVFATSVGAYSYTAESAATVKANLPSEAGTCTVTIN